MISGITTVHPEVSTVRGTRDICGEGTEQMPRSCSPSAKINTTRLRLIHLVPSGPKQSLHRRKMKLQMEQIHTMTDRVVQLLRCSLPQHEVSGFDTQCPQSYMWASSGKMPSTLLSPLEFIHPLNSFNAFIRSLHSIIH